MVKRRLFYTFFFVFLVITLFGSDIYRPYIWSNHINDFGLADSCTNISGTLAAAFLFMGNRNCSKKKECNHIVMCVVIGFILYEFIQLILPWGTFDWKDIIATVIGGALTTVTYEIGFFFINERQNEA